jgi:hypothetical protein
MKLFVLVLMVVLMGSVFAVHELGRELTEVEERALFDIFVEIPEEYHIVGLDDEILFTLRLVNLGGEGRIDVFLEYDVLDVDDEVILGKRETVAIETQASFLRQFDLAGVPAGDYELHARLVYAGGKTADTRHSFAIRREEGFDVTFLLWGVGLLVLLVLLFVFLNRLKFLIEKMKVRGKVREIVRNAKKV